MATTRYDAMIERLAHVQLAGGAHEAPPKADQTQPVVGCLMKIASWVADEPWGDALPCVPVDIGAFGCALNDALALRCSELLPGLLRYVVPLVMLPDAARTPTAAVQRAYLYADFACRVAAPACLRAAALEEQAAELERLPAVVDGATANNASAAAAAAAYTARVAPNYDRATSAAAYAAGAAARDACARAVAYTRAAARAAAYAAAGGDIGEISAAAFTAACTAADADTLRALHPAMCTLFERVLAAE